MVGGQEVAQGDAGPVGAPRLLLAFGERPHREAQQVARRRGVEHEPVRLPAVRQGRDRLRVPRGDGLQPRRHHERDVPPETVGDEVRPAGSRRERQPAVGGEPGEDGSAAGAQALRIGGAGPRQRGRVPLHGEAGPVGELEDQDLSGIALGHRVRDGGVVPGRRIDRDAQLHRQQIGPSGGTGEEDAEEREQRADAAEYLPGSM